MPIYKLRTLYSKSLYPTTSKCTSCGMFQTKITNFNGITNACKNFTNSSACGQCNFLLKIGKQRGKGKRKSPSLETVGHAPLTLLRIWIILHHITKGVV